MKIEKTLFPIVSVLGVAVFIVLCSVLGKTRPGIDAVPTLEPTQLPCTSIIHSLSESLKGECTDGDGFSSLSYRSDIDGESGAVTSYIKSGLVCMSVTRPFYSIETDPGESPDDLFGGLGLDTSSPVQTSAHASYSQQIAEELCLCFSHIPSSSDSMELTPKIRDALESFLNGDVKKANVLYGIYMIKLDYSSADRLLKAVCEPI